MRERFWASADVTLDSAKLIFFTSRQLKVQYNKYYSRQVLSKAAAVTQTHWTTGSVAEILPYEGFGVKLSLLTNQLFELDRFCGTAIYCNFVWLILDERWTVFGEAQQSEERDDRAEWTDWVSRGDGGASVGRAAVYEPWGLSVCQKKKKTPKPCTVVAPSTICGHSTIVSQRASVTSIVIMPRLVRLPGATVIDLCNAGHQSSKSCLSERFCSAATGQFKNK